MDTSPPLVTICIPTYNRAESFLPSTLAAACNQSYVNIDVLVSDNSSTDGTSQLVNQFNDPRIRYYRQARNIGAVKNLDFCIQSSIGEYTLLLMDDDSIDSDFIECCLNAARENPEAGLIRTGARVVDEKGAISYSAQNLVGGLDFSRFVIAWTEGMTLPFMCSTLFRTLPLKKIGINSRYHHWDDVMAEFEIAARYGRIDIPDIKASYRLHSGELTFKDGVREWCEDSRELIDLVCKLAPNDADLLRSHLTPYLALLNYRIAAKLEQRWFRRLQEALYVYRSLGILPNTDFLRTFLNEMPGFSALRSAKQRLWRV